MYAILNIVLYFLYYILYYHDYTCTLPLFCVHILIFVLLHMHNLLSN